MIRRCDLRSYRECIWRDIWHHVILGTSLTIAGWALPSFPFLDWFYGTSDPESDIGNTSLLHPLRSVSFMAWHFNDPNKIAVCQRARLVAIRSLCVYAFVGGTLERVAATRFVRGKHQHHATCSPYNYNALNLLHRRHWARIPTGNCEQIWLRRIYLLVLLFKDESQFTSHKTIIFKLYAKSYICRMSNVLILGDCYRSILISPHENTHTHTKSVSPYQSYISFDITAMHDANNYRAQ